MRIIREDPDWILWAEHDGEFHHGTVINFEEKHPLDIVVMEEIHSCPTIIMVYYNHLFFIVLDAIFSWAWNI